MARKNQRPSRSNQKCGAEAPRSNVFKIFTVRYLEARYAKRGYLHGLALELVIPAESVSARPSEHCGA